MVTDKLASPLAAELSNVGPAVSALETPLPSAEGDLETTELRPDPSSEGSAERQPNVDLVSDKLASPLAAELSNVGPAVSALETPLPSTEGDLEATELRPGPSKEMFAERQPNVDLLTDKFASMLAAELSRVGPAAETPLPSTDGDLEATQLRPGPSKEMFAERQPNVDLLTDKFASMLAAELSRVGTAASALETPLPSTDEI